ncbi:MAG: AI-2E family transporter [Rickettsiales bacterium]|jgi:predicted PurR-regulated permease PerM|nr:AI-2E family transporter [Rickettsiales bacterium]
MNWVLLAMLVVGILKFGQALLAPLLVAVFIWYLLNAVAEYYRRIFTVKNPVAATVGSFAAAIGTFAIFALVFLVNIRPISSQFQEKLPLIESKISSLLHYVADNFGIATDFAWMPSIQSVAVSVGSSVANLAASVGIIMVYLLFLFIEQGTFRNKFKKLFDSNEKYARWHKIISKIDAGIKRYLFVKTAISLATATTSYALMSAAGIDLALFWAFLIFMLNYIPTFGSIVAVSLPVLYAFASLSLPAAVWMTGGLIGIQILFSNIIEPRIMGRTLNLSTLAILVNLVFWGMLWGAVGMFFSVPLLVAAFIVLSHLKPTRQIAVLMSANGDLPDDTDSTPAKPAPKPKKSKS